jgi:membrane-bound lytic murein transglycosylase F
MGGEIIITPIAEDVTTEEIIKMVVNAEIDYTVADNNIAAINQTYYHVLDVNTSISSSQRIAWAVRKNSPELLKEVNSWIDKMKTHTDYHVIYNKYFKNKKLFGQRIKSEFFSETGEKISKFDEHIKKYAGQIGWDWRLLSSLIYQESKFDPHATSWAGGKGLMQLMPATAKELGVKDRSNPEQSIHGGTKYLDQLYERWGDIPDSTQRIKFTMASYNCGYHHVRDAQRLSEKNKDDSVSWDGEVEEYILRLSNKKYYQDEVVKYGYVRGEEPYNYVREIFERYEQYMQFVSR